MTNSIIQTSQLESANRLDAEYYQPEYLSLVKNIKKNAFSTLENFGCKVISGPFGSSLKSDAYLDEGIPFIRINDLQDFFISNKDLIYISEIDNQRLEQSQLKPFDLVLSKVGNTIGIISAISEDLGICNISENNIGIKFIDAKIDLRVKLFLLAFLNSSLGNLQIIRSISGNAQPKLNISDVAQLLVPKPNLSVLEIIKNLITEAKSKLDNSQLLYLQAENLLLEELGLKDYKIEDDLSFVVNLSNIRSSHRIDPDFFQPKYEMIIKKIKDKNPKVFTEVIENIQAKFNPLKNPDNIFRYIELANINSSLGVVDGFSEVTGKEAPSRAKRLLKAGDVIVSSIGGSLDKVALVDKENEGSLASSGFFQLRSKEILPEVLLVLAKSMILKMQLEKQVSGTILAAIPNETLKNIIVPILSQETQKKIADLVKKSHEARKKSKELLEEAKRKVEEIIEKGSD